MTGNYQYCVKYCFMKSSDVLFVLRKFDVCFCNTCLNRLKLFVIEPMKISEFICRCKANTHSLQFVYLVKSQEESSVIPKSCLVNVIVTMLCC